MRDNAARAALQFLDECGLVPTPEAIDQLVDAFLPCLTIICQRGYNPNGASWRAFGWRGLLIEIKKRLGRILHNSWDNRSHDANNAIDLINYTGYYLRLKNAGPPFGDLREPDQK